MGAGPHDVGVRPWLLCCCLWRPGRPPPCPWPQVSSLRAWLKAQPTSRRPLVRLGARVAPEAAVKMLQVGARGF